MKRNWKDVEIPERIKSLPTDERGYPVPVVILVDDEGKKHFKINDDRIVEKCIKDRLCAICGQPMLDDMWLVGGCLSALHPRGAFIDTAVHLACGRYALQVCPYLAYRSFGSLSDIDKVTGQVKTSTSIMYVDPTVMPERPAFFVIGKIRNFTVSRPNPIARYIIPERPFLKMQFWDDGVQITEDQAIKLYKQNEKARH